MDGVKTGAIALLILVMLSLPGCMNQPTPTIATETQIAIAPTGTDSPMPISPQATASGTRPASPVPTRRVTDTPCPLPSQSSSSLPLSPTLAQPTVQPTSSGDGATPQAVPGPAPYLTLPLHTALMPSPPDRPDIPLHGVTTLAIHPDYLTTPHLAAGTDGNGVLISENGGIDWFWSTAGLPSDGTITHLTFASGELVALLADGAAYRSQDSGEQWDSMPGLGEGVEQITFSPAYADDGTLFAVQHGALLRSANRGADWTTVLLSNGCPLNVALSSTFAVDAVAFAPRCEHLIRSNDAGSSWSDVPLESESLNVGYLMNLQVAQDRIFAQGTIQGLAVYSTDGGQSWNRAFNPEQAPFLLGNLWSIHVALDGSIYSAGREHMYDGQTTVWRSTDSGRNWHAVARAAGFGGLVTSPQGQVWLGTPEGIFFNQGDGWQFLHPGGNRPELVSPPSPDVALIRYGVTKYSSKLRLFEKRGERWQLVFEETTNKVPRYAFPSPNYQDDALILLLGQDFGGRIWVMALRPESTEPLVEIDDIPSGRGDSVERYSVQYADDYAASGRVSLRHGYSGALYISSDWGETWARLDPAEPGACERNPTSGFGALWSGNDDVRGQLLCPLEDEQSYIGTIQTFEHGELLRLDAITPSAGRQIYALIPNGEGEAKWGTLPHYETVAPPPEPPAGFFPPDPRFHTAWVEGNCCHPNPLAIRDLLGWGTGEAAGVDIAMQRFEGGTMIWRGDRDEILVLERTAAGDRYTVYPD